MKGIIAGLIALTAGSIALGSFAIPKIQELPKTRVKATVVKKQVDFHLGSPYYTLVIQPMFGEFTFLTISSLFTGRFPLMLYNEILEDQEYEVTYVTTEILGDKKNYLVSVEPVESKDTTETTEESESPTAG